MSYKHARFVIDSWQKLIALILIPPMTCLGFPLPAFASPATPPHSDGRSAMRDAWPSCAGMAASLVQTPALDQTVTPRIRATTSLPR